MSTMHLPRMPLRGVRLDEHLPVDHRLSRVYRVGAGFFGVFLLVFGVLGLLDRIGFFSTGGDTALGLNTNGALSTLSIMIGVVLLTGAVIGGNLASTLNMVTGVAFIVSGFVNLALLESDYNFLAFELQNVLFSFVVGVLLMTFGMYGRVSATLPHDNPYWRARHEQHQRSGPRSLTWRRARQNTVGEGLMCIRGLATGTSPLDCGSRRRGRRPPAWPGSRPRRKGRIPLMSSNRKL